MKKSDVKIGTWYECEEIHGSVKVTAIGDYQFLAVNIHGDEQAYMIRWNWKESSKV